MTASMLSDSAIVDTASTIAGADPVLSGLIVLATLSLLLLLALLVSHNLHGRSIPAVLQAQPTTKKTRRPRAPARARR